MRFLAAIALIAVQVVLVDGGETDTDNGTAIGLDKQSESGTNTAEMNMMNATEMPEVEQMIAATSWNQFPMGVSMQHKQRPINGDYRCGLRQEYCQKGCFQEDSTITCTKDSVRVSCQNFDFSYRVKNASRSTNSLNWSEFQILKRFPDCWSKLVPVLCHIANPQCIQSPTSTEASSSFALVTPPFSLCDAALSACSFVNLSSHSALKSCVRDSNVSPLFSDTCQKDDTLISAKADFDRYSSCMSHSQRTPREMRQGNLFESVVEGCHLSCTEPLFRDHSIWYNWIRTVFHGILVLFSLLIAAYLFLLSAIFERSIVIYCITHALLCNGLYNLLHFLGSFHYFNEELLCDYKILSLRIGFNMCSLESVVISALMLAGSLWLIAHYIFIIAQPSCRFLMFRRGFEQEIVNDDVKSGVGIRKQLFTLIYCSSLIVGILLTYILKSVDADSVSGVCQPGFVRFSGMLFLTIPILVICPIVQFLVHLRLKRKASKSGNKNEIVENGVVPAENHLIEQRNQLIYAGDSYDQTYEIAKREYKWSDALKYRDREGHMGRIWSDSYAPHYACAVFILLFSCSALSLAIHWSAIDRPLSWEVDILREASYCNARLSINSGSNSAAFITHPDHYEKAMEQHNRDLTRLVDKQHEKEPDVMLLKLRECGIETGQFGKLLLAKLFVFLFLHNLSFLPILILAIIGFRNKSFSKKYTGFTKITELRDDLPFLCSCLGQSWKSASVLELAKLVNKDMQTEGEVDREGRRQAGDAIIKENEPPPGYVTESSCGSSIPPSFVSETPTAVIDRRATSDANYPLFKVIKPPGKPRSVAASDAIVHEGRKPKRADICQSIRRTFHQVAMRNTNRSNLNRTRSASHESVFIGDYRNPLIRGISENPDRFYYGAPSDLPNPVSHFIAAFNYLLSFMEVHSSMRTNFQSSVIELLELNDLSREQFELVLECTQQLRGSHLNVLQLRNAMQEMGRFMSTLDLSPEVHNQWIDRFNATYALLMQQISMADKIQKPALEHFEGMAALVERITTCYQNLDYANKQTNRQQQPRMRSVYNPAEIRRMNQRQEAVTAMQPQPVQSVTSNTDQPCSSRQAAEMDRLPRNVCQPSTSSIRAVPQPQSVSNAPIPDSAPSTICPYEHRYSVTPNGFYSRLRMDDILERSRTIVRMLQAQQRLYPQDIANLLLLSGDIVLDISTLPEEDRLNYNRYFDIAQIIPSNIFVPTRINPRIEPEDFIRQTRRRALNIAIFLGLHYRQNARPDVRYHSPIVPDISVLGNRGEERMGEWVGQNTFVMARGHLLTSFHDGR
ncbi:hypothetical protein WR25_06616 isoform E [Diploscapter pachys]|nr:hypothetical protein WR25_06616 isoform C [Diploscapter pachys]PAV89976.1 hypothetical protein WR25_06616 isoform E [Diploscapter pachys]